VRKFSFAHVVFSALVVLTADGCGGSSGEVGTPPPPPPPPPQWGRVVLVQAPRQIADTISHRITDSIVVVVRDTAGTQVRPVRDVDVSLSTGSGTVAGALFFSFAGSTGGSTFRAGRTDSTGRFATAWALGTVTGAGVVAVRADTNFVDTIRFTVLPGRANRVTAAPRDTAVYLGLTYQMAPKVLDRRNNATVGSVSYTSRAPLIAAVSPSGIVSGATYGHATIVVTLQTDQGATTDSADVVVIPRGTIAAGIADFPSGVVVMNLDGSEYRKLANSGQTAWPSWSANGLEVLFADHHYEDSRIYAVDLNGTRRLVSRTNTPNRSELYPRASYDGAWVYFSAGSSWPSYASYRMSLQGTELPVRVGPPLTQVDGRLWKGSPSPDGREFAYRNGGYGLQVVDVATSTVRTLSCPSCGQAEYPRFSRDGNWIAFTHERDFGVSVIRTDGSGYRQLASGTTGALSPVDWSPDGAWLITRALNRLELIRVSDALILRLPVSRFDQPAWRP